MISGRWSDREGLKAVPETGAEIPSQALLFFQRAQGLFSGQEKLRIEMVGKDWSLIEQATDLVRCSPSCPLGGKALTRQPGGFSVARTLQGQGDLRGCGSHGEEGGQKVGFKDEVLVGFANQAPRLIGRPGCRYSDYDDQNSHLLSGDDSLAQVFITSEREDRGDGPLACERHQIPDDQRIDPLLPAADEATQAQLDVRQFPDVELLLGWNRIRSGVVPIDPEYGKSAVIRGESLESFDQTRVVAVDVLPHRRAATELPAFGEEMTGIHEHCASIHPLFPKRKGPRNGPIRHELLLESSRLAWKV